MVPLMRKLLIASLLCATSCGGPPQSVAYVVDVWDNPIPEADVILPGLDLRVSTDEHGRFLFPPTEGALEVKVGRAGYIHEQKTLQIEADDPSRPTVHLYKKPESNGFFAVDQAGYLNLKPQPVEQFGSRLEQIHGIRTLGEAVMQHDQLRVVLHSDLKLDQVMRLGLQLHKLEFVQEAVVSGSIEGDPIPVNLWTTAEIIPLEIIGLRSKTDYLVSSPEGLSPGAYALDTQGLLQPPGAGSFLRIPRPLRVAYPFELR